jgi:PAS domain S-box-containing protein
MSQPLAAKADIMAFKGTQETLAVNASDPSTLRTSEIRYRRLFESARDGILILDAASLKITDVNPFMMELLGYSRDGFLGRELWEIGLFSDKAASQQAFKELQLNGYLRYENLPLQTTDGKLREVEFVSNVYDEDRHPVIQCNIRDITDRKRAEEERRVLLASAQAARAEADTANSLKDEFLATVSHELRTPLTAILGWSQMLASGNLDEQESKRAVETISRNARAQREISFGSAIEALEEMERRPFDVLLSDIGMPEMDGYWLINKIRQLPIERGGRIRAVALTAYAGTEDRKRALLAGYQVHIPKPVELAKLASVVARLAERYAESKDGVKK